MTNKTPEELALDAYIAGLNEKKLKVSDNRIIAFDNRSSNLNWKKSQREADEKRKEFGNSNEWKEYTRQLNQREEWKHNNKIANQNRNLNPTNVLAYQKGMEKRSKNENWKNNVKNASQNRDESWLNNLRKTKSLSGTPIITPEGPFLKFTDGVKFYMPIWNLKRGGADYRLRKLLDDNNELNYYRISLEEYILLTGKEV